MISARVTSDLHQQWWLLNKQRVKFFIIVGLSVWCVSKDLPDLPELLPNQCTHTLRFNPEEAGGGKQLVQDQG